MGCIGMYYGTICCLYEFIREKATHKTRLNKTRPFKAFRLNTGMEESTNNNTICYIDWMFFFRLFLDMATNITEKYTNTHTKF